jgi:hypothetical protein
MVLRRLIVSAGIAVLFAAASVAGSRERVGVQPTQPSCTLPESNAKALVILSNFYPGYWWDHTDLTIAVQPHPKATEEQVQAVQDAIATWSDVLEDCFDGLITLTDVTGSDQNPQRAADIVVHFVPKAAVSHSAASRSAVTMDARTSWCDPICRQPWAGIRTARSTSNGSRSTKSGMPSGSATPPTCSKVRTSWDMDGPLSGIRCCHSVISTRSRTSSPGRSKERSRNCRGVGRSCATRSRNRGSGKGTGSE